MTSFVVLYIVGTGVLLATAFVHLLPEAMENFASPCLDEGWKTYGAFAGVFCMISSFALQLLELAAISNVDRLLEKKQQCGNVKDIDCEVNGGNDHHHDIPCDSSNTNHHHNSSNNAITIVAERPPPADTVSLGSSATTTHFAYEKKEHQQQRQQDHHHHHGHVHSAGLLEDDNAFKDVSTIILELGIVMHSIIIGITLANTQSTEFITLLIALVFHQV